MGSEQLLIGNIAIASIIIKTIISGFKQIFPFKPLYAQIAVMALGVGTAFVINATLLEIADPTPLAVVLQKTLAGLFIGATSMGVHETTKAMTKNA